MITGHFHQSNIGDDAIYSIIYPHFKDFPETIVGGGEYDSWMIENLPEPYYGIGIGLVRDMIGNKRQLELKKFNKLWVRTHADYRLAKMWGLYPLQGADSAVLLEPIKEGFKGKTILIPSWLVKDKRDYPDYDIALPLNPSDNVEGSIELFNQPQEFLNSLIGAKRVITYGRLHAHILSFIAGVEVWDLCPDAKILAWQEMIERYSLKTLRMMALNMIDRVKESIYANRQL